MNITIKDEILAYLAIAGGALLFISLLLPYISITIPLLGTFDQSGMEIFLDSFLDFNLGWMLLFLGLLAGALAIYSGVLIIQNKKVTIPWNELMKEIKLETTPINNFPFENFQHWMLILLSGIFPLITVIEWLLLEYQFEFSIIGLGFYIFIIGTGLILASGILMMNQDYLVKKKPEI